MDKERGFNVVSLNVADEEIKGLIHTVCNSQSTFLRTSTLSLHTIVVSSNGTECRLIPITYLR